MMEGRKPRVVGIGEVLWDIFGEDKRLGGAPLNFAVHAAALGAAASIISRVGEDADGDAILAAVRQFGLPADAIQRDSSHPTGRVTVSIGSHGQPSFTIMENVAWDFLEETEVARSLVVAAEAICFGTLAQRSERSRTTIQSLLRAAAERGKVRWFVCDINFRQHYYCREVVQASLRFANLLKMNEDEVPILLRLLRTPGRGERERIRALMETFALDLVCVTRGERGCVIYSNSAYSEVAGYKVRVADTVGSGDAFTAALVMRLLAGDPPEAAADFANRVGAYVATQCGATPALDLDAIQNMRRA